MKNIKTLAALTVAGLLSTSAMADNITIDQFGDGSSVLEVSKLNLVSQPSVYTLTQYLGADSIFNDGDEFVESAHFNIGSYADWSDINVDLLDADIFGIVPPGSGGISMHLTADLSGHVSNVITDGAAVAADLASNATYLALQADPVANAADIALIEAQTGFAYTSFNINFTLGTVKLFLDAPNSDFINSNENSIGTQIGQWTNVEGFADKPSNNGGIGQSTDFGFNMDFDSAWFDANPAMADVWGTESGQDILDDLFETSFEGAVSSSARPQTITGLGFDAQKGQVFAEIEVEDDGGSFAFNAIPEPTSLAILGLGLCGLGLRRRKA